jgi:hypothetical protein
MAGLAVGLANGRREIVAATVGVICAVLIGLLWDSRVGIVAGGLVGPLAGLAFPAGAVPEPSLAEVAEPLDGGMPS